MVQAASRGSSWLGAAGSVVPSSLAERICEACIEPSDQRFETYVGDLEAENEDRADVLHRMAQRRYDAQRLRLEEQLRSYEEAGRTRLVPALRGRLRALDSRADRRKREIEGGRCLTYSPADTVCVGVVCVE